MSFVILVLLELFLHTSAGPGWFHQDRRPPNQESHGSRPASPPWGAWGSSWDYHQMIHTQNGYLAYNGGSTEHYTPQVYNSTPRPTKKQTTGVIYSTNSIGAAATAGNAIVTSESSLVMGDDRRMVVSGEMSPVSSGEANQNQNFDQFTQNNDKNKGEINPVFIGDAKKTDQNKDHFQNTDLNSNTPGNATSVPEEELVFGAAAIGSMPVPTLNDTIGPAFQWHVGVYSKMWTPYMQICGGSLVKKDVILSAAHCFWADTEGQQPATQFAVAGGKLFRPWTSKKDQNAQRSDVSQIVLPVRFRGITTSFQDDIAVVRLSSPFVYAGGLRPVCVDFRVEFERQQLVPGSLGTVAGWGLFEENGPPSQRLNFLELPYVDVDDCVTRSEPSFVKYITSDKICAGDQKTGKALCRGDSGGGLVFFTKDIPYLRGIASTAAANENLCNAFAIATFTQLHAHRTFLRDNIPDIDKECASDRIDAGTVNGDLVTGTGAEGNNGPINVSHMSRLPFSNFYCNCNCKP